MRIRPSAFDSEMLGIRVGKAVVAGLDRGLVHALRTELADADLDVVFLRDTSFAFERVADLPWEGLELTDVKVILSADGAPPSTERGEAFVVTTDAGPQDSAALLPIVHAIADRSRFTRCFGEAAARRLYDAWLRNALAREAADWFFVARSVADGQPAGLIAVKREDDAADLALVATAERYGGRGVLKLLTAAALQRVRADGVSRCTVATQLSNRTALRAYESMGFTFDRTVVDLHLSRAR